MKIRALETIAALQEVSQNMRVGAATARITANGKGVGKESQHVLLKEAEICDTVSKEMAELAAELMHFRAYATTRNILGPVATLPDEEVKRLVRVIRRCRAALEHTGPVASNVTATVRLVPYYDSSTDENRWAIDYRHSGGDDIITDHALRQDAEYRYWELAVTLGAGRPE